MRRSCATRAWPVTLLRRRGNVLGDGLEAGQEEVADGKVSADAIGQKVVYFGSELPAAVVYDIVGHDTFPFGRKYAIMLAAVCLIDTNIQVSGFLWKGAAI